MNGSRLQQTVVINNAQGFHLRPITAFAQLAARFASTVQVTRDERTVNGKSAWDLITIVAPPGSELTIQVEGPDAPAALAALVELLKNLPEPEVESPQPAGTAESTSSSLPAG